MKVTPYRSAKITQAGDITKIVTESISTIPENSVIVISSKIVAISEGLMVPIESTDREVLIKQQADRWLDPKSSKYGHHFTVKHNMLIGSAGIDTSNGDGNYIPLPARPQETANFLREELSRHYGQPVGIAISDSTSVPLRRGAVGACIAHSGFAALRSYVGVKDLFGDKFQYSVANRAQGIAAAATLAMGEGTEQTPLAVVSDIPNFTCTSYNPTSDELKELYPGLDDDLFEPFWKAIGW